MITWITGNTGSGKTRLAKALQNEYGGVMLDGDAMRRCWTLGFSKEDRWKHNLRIAWIAREIDQQGIDVTIATICPYKDLRREVHNIVKCSAKPHVLRRHWRSAFPPGEMSKQLIL